MSNYKNYVLNATTFKCLIISMLFVIFSVMAEPDAEKDSYDKETESLSDEEKVDRAKYEAIESTVKETLGDSSMTSSALADAITTVAGLFGVDVKVDYDKKGGMSCFSLDSSGKLSTVSCSSPGTVLSSCDATAAADWKSATISCTGFDLTATVVE